eukprot:TRINITY_DN584_c0_g1_i1.p2 TRINITY_DN584_c0_g1~~TRINITY_DN584_c0_g1_i1.p2  ORF type:complete len:113 (-),score=3.77 TRINITY_DN584_c0_g1_i1:2208-2546(-)
MAGLAVTPRASSNQQHTATATQVAIGSCSSLSRHHRLSRFDGLVSISEAASVCSNSLLDAAISTLFGVVRRRRKRAACMTGCKKMRFSQCKASEYNPLIIYHIGNARSDISR